MRLGLALKYQPRESITATAQSPFDDRTPRFRGRLSVEGVGTAHTTSMGVPVRLPEESCGTT